LTPTPSPTITPTSTITPTIFPNKSCFNQIFPPNIQNFPSGILIVEKNNPAGNTIDNLGGGFNIGFNQLGNLAPANIMDVGLPGNPVFSIGTIITIQQFPKPFWTPKDFTVVGLLKLPDNGNRYYLACYFPEGPFVTPTPTITPTPTPTPTQTSTPTKQPPNNAVESFNFGTNTLNVDPVYTNLTYFRDVSSTTILTPGTSYLFKRISFFLPFPVTLNLSQAATYGITMEIDDVSFIPTLGEMRIEFCDDEPQCGTFSIFRIDDVTYDLHFFPAQFAAGQTNMSRMSSFEIGFLSSTSRTNTRLKLHKFYRVI
jgi:hypothetical protein